MSTILLRQELFVSYAHLDAAGRSCLLFRLCPLFAAASGSRIGTWTDGEILAGDAWRAAIFAKIESCAAALLLVSPAFLGSAFVRLEEIPRLRALGKPLIPVLLSPVDFARHDLCGLSEHEIFGLPGRSDRRIAYSDCAASRQKDRFALDLFARVADCLEGVNK